jgi:integrase
LKNTSQNIKVVKSQIIPALDIKIATGEIYKKKPKTFEYYGGIFLKQKDCNKSFLSKQGYYLRVINHFRGQNIDNITRLDIKEYLASLDMISKSKNTYKGIIKEIFELAVDDGVINFNPALGIKLKADIKKEIQYYTKDEVNLLLKYSTGVIRAYLHIAFNTGMRVGEILGLQLADFKNDNYIHIQRTRTQGIIGSGKTNNAIRKVPYTKAILDEVKRILTNHVFIFNNINDASLLRSQWRDTCIDAGVTRYKLYSTRHTFATLMLKENIVSINELAGLLGHSSPKVTLEHYASVIKAENVDLGANFSLFGHDTVTLKDKKA